MGMVYNMMKEYNLEMKFRILLVDLGVQKVLNKEFWEHEKIGIGSCGHGRIDCFGVEWVFEGCE